MTTCEGTHVPPTRMELQRDHSNTQIRTHTHNNLTQTCTNISLPPAKHVRNELLRRWFGRFVDFVRQLVHAGHGRWRRSPGHLAGAPWPETVGQGCGRGQRKGRGWDGCRFMIVQLSRRVGKQNQFRGLAGAGFGRSRFLHLCLRMIVNPWAMMSLNGVGRYGSNGYWPCTCWMAHRGWVSILISWFFIWINRLKYRWLTVSELLRMLQCAVKKNMNICNFFIVRKIITKINRNV